MSSTEMEAWYLLLQQLLTGCMGQGLYALHQLLAW